MMTISARKSSLATERIFYSTSGLYQLIVY